MFPVLLALAGCTNFVSEGNSPEITARRATIKTTEQPTHQPILIERIDLGNPFKTRSVRDFLRNYTDTGDGFILTYEELLKQILAPGENPNISFARWLDDFYANESEMHCDVVIDFKKGQVYLEPENRCDEKYGDSLASSHRDRIKYEVERTAERINDTFVFSSEEQSELFFDALIFQQLCMGTRFSTALFENLDRDVAAFRRKYGEDAKENFTPRMLAELDLKLKESGLHEFVDIATHEDSSYFTCIKENFPPHYTELNEWGDSYTYVKGLLINGMTAVAHQDVMSDPDFKLELPTD